MQDIVDKNLVSKYEYQPPEKNNTILNRLTHICDYACDVFVTARSLPALEALCVELRREAGRVVLVVSPDKTKYMRFSASPSRRLMKGATINGVTMKE